MTKQWLRLYCGNTASSFGGDSRSHWSAFDDGHHSVLRLELIPGSLATSIDHYFKYILSVKFIIHASQSQWWTTMSCPPPGTTVYVTNHSHLPCHCHHTTQHKWPWTISYLYSIWMWVGGWASWRPSRAHLLWIRGYTWDKNTFVTRTNSEFASRPVPHKSTNTIWSTGWLANSEFVLVANLLLSHMLVGK